MRQVHVRTPIGDDVGRARRTSRLGRLGRFVLLSAFLAASGAATPAEAADMRHRLREHLLEAYFLGSFGANLTARGGETVPGQLTAQLGAGVVFPGTGCLGLGAWGFELTAGPALPLGNEDLDASIHLVPSFILELPLSNLQLFWRIGGIFPVGSAANGVSMGFLAGWYARPLSWRVGLVYDLYEDDRAFTGLRFELLWLGEDPIPGP